MFQLANGESCTSIGSVTIPASLPNGRKDVLTFEVLKHTSHDITLGAETIYDHSILWKHARYVAPKKSTTWSGRIASFTRPNRVQNWIFKMFSNSEKPQDKVAYAESLALAIEQMDDMEAQRQNQLPTRKTQDGRTEQDRQAEYTKMRSDLWKDLVAVDPGLADKCRPCS